MKLNIKFSLDKVTRNIMLVTCEYTQVKNKILYKILKYFKIN